MFYICRFLGIVENLKGLELRGLDFLFLGISLVDFGLRVGGLYMEKLCFKVL